MKYALMVVVFAVAAGSSTQIVFMDLDEVLPMAGSILIARVASLETFDGDGWCSGDFSMLILDAVRGSADTGTEIRCSYHLNLPRTFDSAAGPVTWVSPMETGSGHEFFVGVGDTVIALLEEDHFDSAGCNTLLRVEPMDMLEQVLEEMENTEIEGDGPFQGVQNIQVGEQYTHGFACSGGRWRSQELVQHPSGTVLVWEWTNPDEWQDILSMTTETLLITFEVVEIREIEYRGLLPDMPERWKRIYLNRIIDVSIA